MKNSLIMVLIFMLGGCAVTRNAVGRYDDANEIFKGNVVLDLIGHAQIDLVSESSKTRCSGKPYTSSLPPLGYCSGQRGKATLTCSDGRMLDVDWVATMSCKSGRGVGRNQSGATFRFVFGYDDATSEVILSEWRQTRKAE